MTEPPLTGEQIEVTRPEANAWVGASAGTGKTHVLMARVLRMLVTGTPPEKILCLTYTKAAAAEMANRIADRLGRWVMMGTEELATSIQKATGEEPDADMLKRARGLFAAALDVPGGLPIETIHAFCQALLKRFPVEAGLSPHFTVIDERTAAALLGEALAEVMAGLNRNPALGRAFATLAAESAEISVRALIGDFVQKRRRILKAAEQRGGVAGLIAETYRVLGAEPLETESGLVSAALADGAFDRAGLERLIAAAARGSAPEQKRAAVWRRFLAARSARLPLFSDYSGTFFTKAGPPLQHVLIESTLARHPDLADVIAAETRRLDALDARVRLNRVARKTDALIVIGVAVNEAYARKKKSSGHLDYEDLILESERLLAREGIAPWVLYKLDGGIDHVLVDEAQDTNRVQWELINALTGEFPVGASARCDLIRTVFAVGDVKQSIFRFQGAEPEVFALAREHYRQASAFGQIEFLDRQLSLSFRSTASVLDVVHAVFSAPAARVGLGEEPGGIRHRLTRVGEAGRVELWEPEGPDEKAERGQGWRLPLTQRFAATPEAKLAKRIAAKIAALVAKTARDERPIRPGDVMVLVRQRTDFIPHLIRELKARAVPVAGADRMKLHEQLPIQDLLAAARFALLPEDDYTLACVLKGPLIGIDEETLYRICLGRSGSLWDALRQHVTRDTLLKAAEVFLSRLLRFADFRTPFAFFASILQEQGGRRKLIRRLGAEVNDPVDEFLALALAFEKNNPPSLQGFLQWFGESETEIKRDLERGADEVRILTVHGAKGLQAPVVFLPDTCKKPPARFDMLLDLERPGEEHPLFAWIGGRKNALGPLAAAHAGAERRQREEYNRLLYVALTRAEDRLYIGGCLERSGHAAPADSWYAMIADAFKTLSSSFAETDEEGRRILVLANAGAGAKTRRLLRPGHEAVALPAWAATPSPPEKTLPSPVKPSGAVAGDEELPAAARAKALRRGEAVHKLLELLPDVPHQERKAAARRFLKQPAYRLSPREQSGIAARVERLLAHSSFRPLFAPGSRAEAGIAGTLKGVPVAGQVDRLSVGAKEVFFADYKTNRRVPKSLDAVPSAYLVQLGAYAALLRGLYPGKKIRAALVWVEDASLMEIPEGLLDAARP